LDPPGFGEGEEGLIGGLLPCWEVSADWKGCHNTEFLERYLGRRWEGDIRGAQIDFDGRGGEDGCGKQIDRRGRRCEGVPKHGGGEVLFQGHPQVLQCKGNIMARVKWMSRALVVRGIKAMVVRGVRVLKLGSKC
jgi:hypothetical protein